jgi:hypothetical protein
MFRQDWPDLALEELDFRTLRDGECSGESGESE